MTPTEIAHRYGVEHAEYLNARPDEAQGWSALDDADEIPEGDYVTLRTECGEVTTEMEREYRAGFNATFRAAE